MGQAIRTLADIQAVVLAHLASQGVQVHATEPIGGHRVELTTDGAAIRIIGPGSLPASLDVEAVAGRGAGPTALFGVAFPPAVAVEALVAGVTLYEVDPGDGTVTNFDQAEDLRDTRESGTAAVAKLANLVAGLKGTIGEAEGLTVDEDGNLTRDALLTIASRSREAAGAVAGDGPVERIYQFRMDAEATSVIAVGDGVVAWDDPDGFTAIDLATGTTFTDTGSPAVIEDGVLVTGYGLMIGDGIGWSAGYDAATGEEIWRNPTDPYLAGNWMAGRADTGVIAVPLAKMPNLDSFAAVGFDIATGEQLWWLDTGQPGMFTAQTGTVILGEISDGSFAIRFFDLRTGDHRGGWAPPTMPSTAVNDPGAGLMWWTAAASNDDGTDTIWCIDSRAGAQLDTLRLPPTKRTCDAGNLFLQEGDQVLRRRPGAGSEVLARGFRLVMSRNGYTIATSSYGLGVWDSATGTTSIEVQLNKLFPSGWSGELDDEVITIDGTDLIVAQDGILAVVDLRDGTVRQHEALEPMAKIEGITSADGRRWVILSNVKNGVIVPIVASTIGELDEVLRLLDGVTATLAAAPARPELGAGETG